MTYLSFGEIMLRMRAPERQRFFQSNMMEATFGGAEANVAVALSNFGDNSGYMTVLPENDFGTHCINELRRFGVDTSKIIRGKGRMGIYFLEDGSNLLPSKVIYDREYSSMALAVPEDYDWNSIFEGISWMHISGITPAISDSARCSAIHAVTEAKKRGITVSCDLNYRKNLWKYGKKAIDVMPEIVAMSDVITGDEGDIMSTLGITSQGDTPKEKYENLCRKVLTAYPNLKYIAVTMWENHTSDHISWQAGICDGESFVISKKYEVTDIVDRVGAGDSFSAGLIHGLNNYKDLQTAVEFASASAVLKYSINGDFNRVSEQDVLALMGGDGSFRR